MKSGIISIFLSVLTLFAVSGNCIAVHGGGAHVCEKTCCPATDEVCSDVPDSEDCRVAEGSEVQTSNPEFTYETLEISSKPIIESVMQIPVCEVPYGSSSEKSRDMLTYAYYADGDGDGAVGRTYLAPEGFCVMSDGRAAILDTYGKYIRIYNMASGKEERLIDVSVAVLPYKMAVIGDSFYVLDNITSKIYEFSGENTFSYQLPKAVESIFNPNADDNYDVYEVDMGPLVASLRVDNRELVVCASIYGNYRLVNGEFVKCSDIYNIACDDEYFNIKYGGYSWKFSSVGMGIDIKGVDGNGNLYVYCCSALLDKNGSLTGDNTLRVYDKNSNLIAGSIVDNDTRYALPSQHIALGEDNAFYEMVCDKGTVSIVRLGLSTAVAIIENHVSNSTQSSALPCETRSGVRCATVTYSEAYNVALSYTTHSFTVNTLNQHDWDGNGTAFELPGYVASAASGSTVSGIPYSTGDEDSISSFDTLLTTYYSNTQYYHSAGNIADSSLHHQKACGADCSGYAINAYCTDGRPTTETYYSTYGFQRTAENLSLLAQSAQRMDYWVYSYYDNNNVRHGHIMMHATFNSSNNTLTVYDTTKTTTGKASIRSMSLSSLSSRYILKNPWHATCDLVIEYNGSVHFLKCQDEDCQFIGSPEAHTWSIGYMTNSTKHWHYCTVCNKAGTQNNHTAGTSYSSNATQHWCSCTVCSYAIYSDHIWKPYGLNYRCGICGRISTAKQRTISIVPILPCKKITGLLPE